jgi:hypothetical protein
MTFHNFFLSPSENLELELEEDDIEEDLELVGDMAEF